MNQKEANEKILKLMNKDSLSTKEIQLFKELIFQCDLKQKNYRSYTPLMYACMYNQEENLNLSEEQWDYLIKNSDLKIQDFYGDTPLMYAFIYNKYQNLNLSEEQLNYLIKNSDLIQKTKSSSTPLIYALMYNKDQNLNLSEEQMDYLIKNSDLRQQNKNGGTILMYALQYNKSQNLNLNQEQIDYLIKNSDLKQKNYDGWTILMYALQYNKSQNLKLTKKQFQEMYDALVEKEQQTTFQKLIYENVEDDHQYLEEINLFLYDLQFQPNKKILSWLKENKHQDILERIEKRNLFFQLNQTIKKIDNYQKIAKIKL